MTKRSIFFSLALLIVTTLSAQTTHLKFMGIPLTGTINNFQTKLQQKGFYPDATVNRVNDVGTRYFKGGTFSGEKAEIFVYYNPKTKIVYKAKACIDRSSDENVKSLYSKFKYSIGEKYKNTYILKEGRRAGYESANYYVYNMDDTLLGIIYLHISEDDSYWLHID